MKILYKILFVSILNLLSTHAQQLVLPIQNYSSVEYGAASQNWGISIDNNGIIYAANNRGLLIFNGQSWQLKTLANGGIIRSVYANDSRVYTGSYKEFGYWEKNEKGEYNYTSLKDLFDDIELSNEEFWDIIEYNQKIYFRSFGGLYEYDGSAIKRIEEGVFSAFCVYNDQLLVSTVHSGIYKVENGSLVSFLSNEDVEDIAIRDINTWNEKLLIGTRENLFFYKNGKLEELNKDLSDVMARYELNNTLSLDDKQIVLGTLKNGCYIFNSNNELQHINRSKGLQNNTILGLAFFKNSLWIGLDNGIDRVDIDSAIQFYTNDTGELGAVYDLLVEADRTLIASNTGVYSLDKNGLKLIPGAEGHAWAISKLPDGRIVASCNSGTYEIVGNKLKVLENTTGSFILNYINNNNILIGTYTGIARLVEGNVIRYKDLNFPASQIVFENERTIWAAHAYEGLYRISFSNDLSEVQSIRRFSELDSLAHFNPSVTKINNQIAISASHRWYRYNSFNDKVEDFDELSDLNGYSLLTEYNGDFWFVNKNTDDLFFTDLKNKKLKLPGWQLKHRLVKDFENVNRISDSIYYFSLKDGFAKLNSNALLRKQEHLYVSEPFVAGISGLEKTYTIIEEPKIAFEDAGMISFDLGMPFSDANAIEYKLYSDSDTLVGIIDHGKLQFQNLKYGEYQLQLSPNLKQSTKFKIFAFEILAPWYYSSTMKVIYALLVLSLVGIIFWFNRRRLLKHQLQIERKFEKEHKERINRLEKEKLLEDINMKRKELANTTMMAAKKNEVLMEIQSELAKENTKLNQYKLKHIINKINTAVKNKEEWQVFETNFNEVHEDFFKDLLKEYPKLTSKDLKLSAYLKMNLTSKEIAPLMGISIRGVEVHRYRLRKKMDLDKEVNLSNFLIKKF